MPTWRTAASCWPSAACFDSATRWLLGDEVVQGLGTGHRRHDHRACGGGSGDRPIDNIVLTRRWRSALSWVTRTRTHRRGVEPRRCGVPRGTATTMTSRRRVRCKNVVGTYLHGRCWRRTPRLRTICSHALSNVSHRERPAGHRVGAARRRRRARCERRHGQECWECTGGKLAGAASTWSFARMTPLPLRCPVGFPSKPMEAAARVERREASKWQWTTNALNGALRRTERFPARTAAPVRPNRVVAPAFKANPAPRRAACREPITRHARTPSPHAGYRACRCGRWCWRAGGAARSRTTNVPGKPTASAPSCARACGNRRERAVLYHRS